MEQVTKNVVVYGSSKPTNKQTRHNDDDDK